MNISISVFDVVGWFSIMAGIVCSIGEGEAAPFFVIAMACGLFDSLVSIDKKIERIADALEVE